MSERIDRLLPLVVGAHLRAEHEHRPIVYDLHDRLVRAIGAGGGLDPAVCTDLWYLNQPELRARPTISVGSPAENALTAFLADKLPIATAVEGLFAVQLDLDFVDLQVCIWGVDARSTSAGVDAFVERYLPDFVRESACRRAAG